MKKLAIIILIAAISSMASAKDYDKTNKLASTGFEQGALGENYFLTMLAALADKENVIPDLFA